MKDFYPNPILYKNCWILMYQIAGEAENYQIIDIMDSIEKHCLSELNEIEEQMKEMYGKASN